MGTGGTVITLFLPTVTAATLWCGTSGVGTHIERLKLATSSGVANGCTFAEQSKPAAK